MLNHDSPTSPGLAPTIKISRSPRFVAALQESELRRVREADGLSPFGPPPVGTASDRLAASLRPLQLLWHLRDVKVFGAGSYLISVPLTGNAPAADASAELQRILEQMWVHYPTSELSAATSVSVVLATVDPAESVANHRLTIQLSVDPSSDRRVDGTQMARHLRAALEQLAAA